MRKLLWGVVILIAAVFAVIGHGSGQSIRVQVPELQPVAVETSVLTQMEVQSGAALVTVVGDQKSCEELRAYMDGSPPGAKYTFTPVGFGEPRDTLCPCSDGTSMTMIMCTKGLADRLAHPLPRRPPRNSSWCIDELKDAQGKCPRPQAPH